MIDPENKNIVIISDIKDFNDEALRELSEGKGDDSNEQQSISQLHQDFPEQDKF